MAPTSTTNCSANPRHARSAVVNSGEIDQVASDRTCSSARSGPPVMAAETSSASAPAPWTCPMRRRVSSTISGWGTAATAPTIRSKEARACGAMAGTSMVGSQIMAGDGTPMHLPATRRPQPAR